MDTAILTEKQKIEIKTILAQVIVGRGKVVEDISKKIVTILPLTEKQVKRIDDVVEAFVYGGGAQEQLEFQERLDSGLEYIMQKVQEFS